MSRHGLTAIVLLTICILIVLGLTACMDPKLAEAVPWTVRPLRQETKDYFCQKMGLAPNHPVCRADKNVKAADLVPVLRQRFLNRPYRDVATTLQDYPVADGNGSLITGGATYLLTEFDNFCVFFDLDRNDPSGIVKEINIGIAYDEGRTPPCFSDELLQKHPRLWLTPTP